MSLPVRVLDYDGIFTPGGSGGFGQDGLLESINLSIAVELRCDARCVAGTAVHMLSSPPSLAFCYQVCVLPGVRDG